MDSPVTSKSTETGGVHFENLRSSLRWGVSEMQGWRARQEDAHLCIAQLPNDTESGIPGVSLFSILDGHGGPFISQAISHALVQTICENRKWKEPSPHVDIGALLCESFMKVDRDLMNRKHLGDLGRRMGSTIIACAVTQDAIVCANAGDSRAVLCRGGSVKELSTDHKPHLTCERKRIENAGGHVRRNRVCGSLAVSRSIGDYYFKQNPELPPEKQLMTAMPDVRVVPRKTEEDEFLLIACDGVWDVFSSEEAVRWVRHAMRSGVHGGLHDVDLKSICEGLCDEALSRGSRDNISVLVVCFAAGEQLPRKFREMNRLEKAGRFVSQMCSIS
eukprot:g4264.t1